MRTPIDRTVFESAVRAHHADVYRSALRITRDESTALDAVQETFRRVLEGDIDLSNARDIGLLLRCAAARQALMSLRSERARARREVETAMMRPERYEDRRSDDREIAENVERALNELPHELRNALVLRFREGLTFAQVGEVLSIAEPSAFERVQRGLDKLRQRLSRLGCAPALADLGELLSDRTAAHVPPNLETQLMGLSKSSFVSLTPLSGLATGLLAVAVILGVATVAFLESSDSESSQVNTQPLAVAEPTEPLTRTTEPPTERRAVDLAGTHSALGTTDAEHADDTTTPAQFPPVRLEGLVIDMLELPVVGARVTANSVRFDGKFAVFTVTATTDRDGRFSLDLPIEFADGEEYVLQLHTGTLVRSAGNVRALPRQTQPFRTLRFDEEITDRPGPWEVRVSVFDDRGAPVEGALVHALKPVRNAEGQSWLDRDDSAQTDASGMAVLAGERLGPKLLRVDARAFGWAPFTERLELAQAGEHRRDVHLTRGLEVRGSIVDHQGQPCARNVLGGPAIALYATADDSNEWYAARVDDDGHFTIPALAAKPHRVRFHSEVWSPFTLRDVRPGGELLAIELKLRHDPTERGTHDAELLGSVVDAASGAPVELDLADVFVERIADDSPALRDRDVAPLFVGRRRPQTFQSELNPYAPPPPPPHTFSISLDEPGRYLVCVQRRGFAPNFAGAVRAGRTRRDR
jgi:RNA polymerase sigma-70 factor (ECF subfamily)